MTARFTVFGGGGFVGRHLTAHLTTLGHQVDAPARGTEQDHVRRAGDLGHVVYAIGLTADFRARPLDAVDAHVSVLSALLRQARFASWTYLSSTRVYAGLGEAGIGTESAALPVSPDADQLYNLSKLTGEAMCIGTDNPAMRAVRLSNVYGAGQGRDAFLGAVLAELAAQGRVTIGEAETSSKDYVAVEDVCTLIPAIAMSGTARLYNIASGAPVTHARIARALAEVTGGICDFAPGGPHRAFPKIDTTRIETEFGHRPRALIDDLLAGNLTREPRCADRQRA